MSSNSYYFLLSFLLPTIFTLSCLNSQGNAVDWWVYLKTPKSIYEDTTYFAMYYDSTMSSSDFEFIAQRIDQYGGALYNTLMSTHSSDYELIAWNDENPLTGTTSSAPTAHSKGVIGLDSNSNSGFYMQHSMPKYPNIVNNQIDPVIDDSELTYGQNIMCLSVSADTLESMATNLLIIKAYIYFQQNLSSDYPNLALVYYFFFILLQFGNKKYNKTISSLNLNFTLNSGLQMKMFSKSGYFSTQYIFENQIVPALQTSLYCETWGRPYQNASCDISSSDYFVEEVLYLNFTQSGVAWKSTQDHSKWTISAQESTPWVCFGDINKMNSQSKRGGSYFCMLNNQLWNMMSQAITSEQSCPTSEIQQQKITLQALIYEATHRKNPN